MNQERFSRICFRLTEWSLAVIVFFIPIYFAWFHENYTVFDLNKSVALHLLLTLGLVSWLLSISFSGRAAGAVRAKVMWLVIAAGGLFTVSALFSLHPDISVWGSYERQQGLYNLLYYLLLFCLIGVVIHTRQQMERLLVALLAGAAIVSLYGALQLVGWDFLRWAESGADRVFSTFGQPNFLGHYLIVALPLTIYGFFWISRKPWAKILFIILALLETITLIFTYSRSAWLGGLAAAVGLIFWIVIRQKKFIVAWSLGIIILGSAFVLSFNGVRQGIVNHVSDKEVFGIYRLVSILDTESGSNQIRLNYWKAAVQDFQDASWPRKLFGYGPDVQASVYVRDYQPQWAYYERINSFPDRAHNIILDILLQFGLTGLIVLGALSGIIITDLLRRTWRETDRNAYWFGVSLLVALAAYGVNNLFSFSLTAMSVVFWTLLAIAALAGNNFKAKEVAINFFQPLSRLLLTLSLALFLLVIFYTENIRFMVADYYYMQVKKAEARQDCRAVMDNLENVLEWYPSNHYYERAYIHHGTNCFSAASTAEAKTALARNLLEQAESIPDDRKQYYTLIDLAHVYSILGYYMDEKYYATAEAYYQELIRLSPAITVNYQDYGRMKLWQGKYSEAIRLFHEGIAAAPDLEKAPAGEHGDAIARQVAYFHDLIGLALYEQRDFNKALVSYKQAITIDPAMASSYKKIADIYYEQENFPEAIRYNKAGYELEPRSSVWPLGLAILYKEQGDKKTALAYAREAQALDTENARIAELVKELEQKK